MSTVVVWSADQPVARTTVLLDAAAALVAHFVRLATGARR